MHRSKEGTGHHLLFKCQYELLAGKEEATILNYSGMSHICYVKIDLH